MQETISISKLQSVEGRVVIVTGAGQGLGRYYAKGLAMAGSIPVVADIDEAKVKSVVREVEDLGKKAVGIQVDVSDPSAVERMAQVAEDALGRIDGIINNAAISSTLKMRPFDQIPYEEWCRVIDVNVTGVMLCCKAVLPFMKRSGWGRIINISSGTVTVGQANYMHYTTSKAAIIGLTRSMAREVGGAGITVNAILPGATFTEVSRETVSAEMKKALPAMQCIPRLELPEDLLGTVLFLLSEGAAFITGQSIAVDGGLTHR